MPRLDHEVGSGGGPGLALEGGLVHWGEDAEWSEVEGVVQEDTTRAVNVESPGPSRGPGSAVTWEEKFRA